MKWLFLAHQINSRERVRVWRMTKKIGAALYRNSVYVLPYSKERLEDFQWLCQEIRDSHGKASVFTAESKDRAENRELRDLFIHSREKEYNDFFGESAPLLKRLRGSQRQSTPGSVIKTFKRREQRLRDTLNALEQITFFPSVYLQKGRSVMKEIAQRIQTLVQTLETGKEPGVQLTKRNRREFNGKVWATRSHIHIDRLCSAWLIKRFIDPKATFAFAPESKLPKNAVLFDVFGVEFGHHSDDCTFETLLKSFQLKDYALHQIAEIVHDIDMKDNKFSRPEASGVDAVVRSISDFLNDDQKALDTGTIMLDGLYKRFSYLHN